MKKIKFLVLFALALLLFSCRTEDLSSETFSNEIQKENIAKIYSMKDVPDFKNFLNSKINSSDYFSKSNIYAALLFDNQPVDIVKKSNKNVLQYFYKDK